MPSPRSNRPANLIAGQADPAPTSGRFPLPLLAQINWRNKLIGKKFYYILTMEQISTLTKSKRVNSLLTEAKQLTGISKKVNLIEMALEYLIKYKKRLNLINMAGNIAFNVDLNATRGRK